MEKEKKNPEEIVEEVVVEEEIIIEETMEEPEGESPEAVQAEESEAEAEEPEIIIGKSTIRGVAVNSKDLEKATEDYPIVLNVYEDFFPVHPGDLVKSPQDAVVPMDKIQIIGPMIRIIEYFEPMTNIEPIDENEQGE